MKIFQFAFLVLLLLLAGCSDQSERDLSHSSKSETLRVGFPPDENPAQIISKNQPLLAYLKRELGLEKIEIVVPETYTAAVEEMQHGNLDMVYFGGLTYVLAKRDTNITPIVRGKVDGTVDNFTYIITRKDSQIKNLKDLKGHSFAFGDVASTSGHLIPHKKLRSIGISPTQDFSALIYTGAHDKTAYAVFKKEVDAGAMNARLLPILIKDGKIDGSKIRILWKSDAFADYPWAVRTQLGKTMIDKLTQAFVKLRDKEILKLLKVEAYEPTSDSEFNNIREAAITLGFMEK